MKGRTAIVGELRPSQLLYTYGVASIIDLPYFSAMVMGLDDWDKGRCRTIVEDRLLEAARRFVGKQLGKLVAPPMPPEEERQFTTSQDPADRIGVPVATFPRVLRCPACHYLGPLDSGVFDLKTDPYRPERTRYVHTTCPRQNAPTVLPARFLVACDNGHLDDFPWHFFVHGGSTECQGQLEFRELGITGEAAEVEVFCRTCGNRRRMAEAFGEQGERNLPKCRGRRAQLRDFDEKDCEAPLRTILLGATNSWFPVTLAALALPVSEDSLPQLVSDHWDILADVDEPGTVKYLRKQGKLQPFEPFDDAQVFEAIEAVRVRPGGDDRDPTDLKGPEWDLLTGEAYQRLGVDFLAREVTPPRRYGTVLRRVLLVERLREVTALLGFTRITAPQDMASGGEQHRWGKLTRSAPTFVPASEVRGEGIFLQFKEARIAAWATRSGDRADLLFKAHQRWRAARKLDPPDANFPGLRYVLLHSFAHALMRQLALECGYSAASIRERIYAQDPGDKPPMAGILLYTAAPDSEGTMGGLVSLGQPERLERHIASALRAMQLCASDPLCAEHRPIEDKPTLHYAACHACLFAPETSCEQGNRYLDRAVLVPTLAHSEWAFFTGDEVGER